MTFKNGKWLAILAGLTLLASAAFPDDPLPPQREELLFQEVPVVVTAAKHEQPFADSPSTISVITEEDIKLSGATNLEELFRSLPGMDIFIASATNTNVSARGQGGLMPHNILTMIDGFSVYEDFLGLTLWEILPVTLADIKRIEVIKGPGSALYGANAFAGVINIITKSPDEDETDKTSLSAIGGEQNSGYASFLTAGNWGNNSGKLSLGCDRANNWDNPAQEAGSFSKGNFAWQYKPDKDRKLSFSAYLSQGNASFVAPQYLTTTPLNYTYTANSKYFHLAYEEPGLTVKSFLNSGVMDLFGTYNVLVNTYDVELQRSLQPAENNSLILGGNARLNQISGNILDASHDQTLWATYLQDEIKVKKNITLTLGGRYDHHPLVGDHFSPRASLVCHPAPAQTLRFSAATAFRNPSYSESYLNLPIPVSGTLTANFQGNQALEPEILNSCEIAFETPLWGKTTGGVNLFYSDINNFIDYAVTEYFPGSSLPARITTVNTPGYKVTGGELSFSCPVTRALTLSSNYSYQQFAAQTGPTRTSSPADKFNFAARYLAGKFSANLLVHYQSGTATAFGSIDPYTLANLYLGYRCSGNSELSLAAFNLLNFVQREYPLTDEIGRKVTLGVKYDI